MNELQITNEDIELLKEMKENCLKADAYDDEKRLLKANAITKFLNLYNNWNELKKFVNRYYDYYMNNEDFIGGRLCFADIKNKMQEMEQVKDE